MPVLESVVARVVNDTSERMETRSSHKLPLVTLAQSQPALASYVSGGSSRIGARKVCSRWRSSMPS